MSRSSGNEGAAQPQPTAGAVGLEPNQPLSDGPSVVERMKRAVIGAPRNLQDKSVFQHVSLVAFLAWVGLGADGLSSSCYGPPEAFHHLGEHGYLAVFLAAAIVMTVLIISACYSHIIEEFPSGGGGYLVASKLLGNRVGVVSGCALLVDYVLTISVSIAAAGDALFGLLGPHWLHLKLPAELVAIVVLIVLNLRGVKESVQFLLPIFVLFLLTHAALIFGSILMNLSHTGTVISSIATDVSATARTPGLGIFFMLNLLLYAYSMGAGTYTGIEAVSNSMPVMREPRVATAKRTMRYMAISLAVTAGGLIVAYLLMGITRPDESGKTMNQLLTEAFVEESGLSRLGLGTAFILATLISEGALLFVAAQAGFIDGPRVLANLAHDSWAPRWFANLSERLATHNGVLLMGLSALAALLYSQGNIVTLIIMYSINVFVTFSLSMIGMCRHWYRLRGEHPLWRRRLGLFAVGALMCLLILVVTIVEKLDEGAWRTIVVTGTLVGVSFFIHGYYRKVGFKLKKLDQTLGELVPTGAPNLTPPDPEQPTAIVLVGGYSGLGIHTMLNAVRLVPDHFANFVFLSVGVVDSGNFKGAGALQALQRHTEENLARYVDLGQRLGMPSAEMMSIGTDAIDELERLCLEAMQKYPRSLIFAGQLVFQKDTWLHRLLHNQTAYALQRRLQWAGYPMIILPTRVR